LEVLELELFGNKICCQFSQYPEHIPSHDITRNLVPIFVYSMKPPHHQNNGQAIKKCHKRTITSLGGGVELIGGVGRGNRWLGSCIQVFSL
jgi:hypothetical protein